MRSRVAALSWILVILWVVGWGVGLASRTWFPENLSLHGQGIQRMLDYTLWATGLFFVAGHLVLAWLILRGVTAGGPDPVPSPRAQLGVGLLPAFLMALVAEGGVLVLGLPVWARYYGPAPPEAIQVEVTGRQFVWTVRYPGPDGIFGRTDARLIDTDNTIGLDHSDPTAADDVVDLNELTIPATRPVVVTLRSRDVIHSFFVRELRVKQNAVPGMAVSVWFTALRPGEFELICNQICGLGHYRMRGRVHALEPAAFDAWLKAREPFFGASS